VRQVALLAVANKAGAVPLLEFYSEFNKGLMCLGKVCCFSGLADVKIYWVTNGLALSAVNEDCEGTQTL
jgi:hypothetical protein